MKTTLYASLFLNLVTISTLCMQHEPKKSQSVLVITKQKPELILNVDKNLKLISCHQICYSDYDFIKLAQRLQESIGKNVTEILTLKAFEQDILKLAFRRSSIYMDEKIKVLFSENESEQKFDFCATIKIFQAASILYHVTIKAVQKQKN